MEHARQSRRFDTAEIQALTGITNEMVRDAPSFRSVADEVAARTAGALFVAHNARFDYGFLKHAFARLQRRFSARVLCTVRLSRGLFPEEPRHSLDSVIARHRLPLDGRHRALGDARVLWAFVRALYRDLAAETIEHAARRVLRTPSLPPQLAPDAIEVLPEAPGVYLFYGSNALPLYIGKSNNLRERVGAHFSSDYRSATDCGCPPKSRESNSRRRRGKSAHCCVKRRSSRRCCRRTTMRFAAKPNPACSSYLERRGRRTICAPRPSSRVRSPDASDRSPRDARRLTYCARSQASTRCAGRRSVSRSAFGPCFARQLKRCAGACVGAESADRHHTRLADALAPFAVPRWPHAGLAAIRERSLLGDRTDVHVLRDWCWLGTAHDDGGFAQLVDAPPRPAFDADIARLLMRTFARARHDVRAIGVAVCLQNTSSVGNADAPRMQSHRYTANPASPVHSE
jgi:DNA polymerase-3 subunit epsilon